MKFKNALLVVADIDKSVRIKFPLAAIILKFTSRKMILICLQTN